MSNLAISSLICCASLTKLMAVYHLFSASLSIFYFFCLPPIILVPMEEVFPRLYFDAIERLPSLSASSSLIEDYLPFMSFGGPRGVVPTPRGLTSSMSSESSCKDEYSSSCSASISSAKKPKKRPFTIFIFLSSVLPNLSTLPGVLVEKAKDFFLSPTYFISNLTSLPKNPLSLDPHE